MISHYNSLATLLRYQYATVIHIVDSFSMYFTENVYLHQTMIWTSNINDLCKQFGAWSKSELFGVVQALTLTIDAKFQNVLFGFVLMDKKNVLLTVSVFVEGLMEDWRLSNEFSR